MINLCILDMDGTLIDSETYYLRSFVKSINDLGYNYDEEYMSQFIGRGDIPGKLAIMEKMGNDFPFDTYMNKAMQYFDIHMKNKEIGLCKGAKELLEYLKNNNIKTCLCTSTKRELVDIHLNNNDINKYFKYKVCGEDVTKKKPEPDSIFKCLEITNTNIEDAILIEDSRMGCLAARNAKIKYILVPGVAKLIKDDYDNAFYVAKDLLDATNFIKNHI